MNWTLAFGMGCFALGAVVGRHSAPDTPGCAPATEPPPQIQRKSMLAFPLGACDARVVQRVGLNVYRDGCYVRREPPVWL